MAKKIKLTQGKYAIVDDEDFESLSKFKWYADKGTNTFYAVRKINKVNTKMHNVISGFSMTDHINGNGLDNRRSNLRECSYASNAWNRGKQSNNKSGYKGVSFSKNTNKWVAQIVVNHKHTHIGLFADKKEAASKYNEYAKRYFGEFARLNDIQ